MSILPPQRPPSRSERLLRETLRRDGEVRESGITSPSRRPSASRRHSSRVSSPTSPPLPASASCGELRAPRPSSPSLSCRYAELADEQYTRGTFLFRSAITNAPNSPQFPGKMECMYAPAHPHVQGPISTDGTVVPVLNGNGPHSPSYHPRMSTRSASPSPPPTLNGGIGRRHSLQRSFHHEARTPQEHALRAQLENYFEDTQRSSPMTICRRCDQVNVGVSACCDQTRSESMSQPQFVQASSSKSGPSPYLQEPPTRTHVRGRSSTDPPPHTNSQSTHSTSRARTATYTATTTTTTTSAQSASYTSPRRSSAMTHSPQLSTQLQVTRSRKHNSVEVTPPLTADASPTGIGEGNELEPDYHLDDSRLITPPPSPPLHINSNASRKSHQLHHPQPHSPSPYRPIGDWYPSTEDNHQHAQPGRNHNHHHHPNAHALRMPPIRPHLHHSPQQQTQFNVRKASEQCKLIDGYVSFLSIEGLGGPPDADSPIVGNEEDEENQNRDKRMFGIGWNGLKRLLPLAVVGAMNSGNATGHETSPSTTTAAA